MVDPRIIYTRADGGVSVVVPAPGVSLAYAATKAVPVDAVNPRLLDAADLPDRDEYRNAWRDTGRAIQHDMPVARAIHRELIRAARKPLLEALDIEYMRALEFGSDSERTQIAADKQELRNATADPRIEAATTIEELKAVWPLPKEGE